MNYADIKEIHLTQAACDKAHEELNALCKKPYERLNTRCWQKQVSSRLRGMSPILFQYFKNSVEYEIYEIKGGWSVVETGASQQVEMAFSTIILLGYLGLHYPGSGPGLGDEPHLTRLCERMGGKRLGAKYLLGLRDLMAADYCRRHQVLN